MMPRSLVTRIAGLRDSVNGNSQDVPALDSDNWSREYAPADGQPVAADAGYSPPPLPLVPSLDESPAWVKCKADHDAIVTQLQDAQGKHDRAVERMREVESVLSTRSPNAAVVAQIAAAASEIAALQETLTASRRVIETLERGRRLAESTLQNVARTESAKLRRPFAELHQQECRKVATKFDAALSAFQLLYDWSRRWPGVGIGEPIHACAEPNVHNSYGQLVKLLRSELSGHTSASPAWRPSQIEPANPY